MMKKFIAGATAFGASVLSVFAEGTSIIDTTNLATQVNQIKTDVTGFFSGTVGPVVLAILGGVFLIWLSFVIFRWIRRAAK